MHAAKHNHIDCLTFLIELGDTVDGVRNRETALTWTADFGRFECIDKLPKAGADPNFPGNTVDRPYLAFTESLQCIELLLRWGADVNANAPDGTTALTQYAQRGNFNGAKVLLENGATIDYDAPVGRLPLTEAVRLGDASLVALLVGYGADLEVEDEHGRTPLIMASRLAQPNILRVLLVRGANVNARDSDGATALHRIARPLGEELNELHPYIHSPTSRRSIGTRLLIEHNADVDALDKMGRTPLYHAMENELPRIAEMLLQSGATSAGSYRLSPLEIAREVKDELGAVFRAHFHKARMRSLRGIIRFLIVSSRYREVFYRVKYVAIGTQSFARRKRKLKEADALDRGSALKSKVDRPRPRLVSEAGEENIEQSTNQKGRRVAS